MLAMAVSGEEDLGLEVNTKQQSLALAPGGDHLSPSQLAFVDVFSHLPG